MPLLTAPNNFAPRFKPEFGIPAIKPQPGETFDVNNDLTLLSCGTRVMHRDGSITSGTAASVTHDALIEYNRRHLKPEIFADYYGDPIAEELSEMRMLHGDFA